MGCSTHVSDVRVAACGGIICGASAPPVPPDATPLPYMMGSDVLVAAITVPTIVLICVFVFVSAAVMLTLYHKKKSQVGFHAQLHQTMKCKLSCCCLPMAEVLITTTGG